MTRQAAVIFDMDGTLADCAHRLHWLSGPGKKNWPKFFAGCKDDLPREELVRLAQELSSQNAIVIASGRPEHLRQDTVEWLKKFNVPYEAIYLRPNHDNRQDGIVKSEMIALMQKDGYEPWLAVDDRDTAVSAWREHGICCLQCDESRY